MADNKLVGNIKNSSKQTIKQGTNKTNSPASLLLSFDDETDACHILVPTEQKPFVDISYNDIGFRKPLKCLETEVSYDSASKFYQDLGFTKQTIDRLKPSFSSLEQFVDYDVYSVIERLEIDLLENEDNMDKLIVNSQKDFFHALRLFGFEDEWAQTYTWAMGEAYADQLVKHSVKEFIRCRLQPVTTVEDFPDWTNTGINNNQWSSYTITDDKNIFLRKQERESNGYSENNLDEIDFDILKNLSNTDQGNRQYWFHATNWNGAQGIIENGAERRGENTDFARNGVYYLNDNYWDSYEWLSKRDTLYQGMYAILIYEFDPQEIANGNYIWLSEETDTSTDLRLWHQIVFSCINIRQNEVQDLNRCQCVYGWQCSNPNAVRPPKANKNVSQRRLRNFDGQYATQLAIRTNRMLTRVDEHLIGVIVFKARRPSRL